MPGLFGIFNKTTTHDNPALLQEMSQALHHYDYYQCNTKVISGGGVGKIDVNAARHSSIYYDPVTSIVVCLYGDIYKIIDVEEAEDKVFDNDRPEKKIAVLYHRYQEKVAEKLNGDFVLSIYDPEKKKMMLCNDRFGFRHTYVYDSQDIVMFAPEMKALFAYKKIDKSIDEQGIADYFNYSYHLGNRTNFKKIKLLPPASCYIFEKELTTCVNYWRPEYSNRINISQINEAADTGYQLFRRSLYNRVGGSSSVLIPLSGGLDSRLIASTANDLGCKIQTATFGRRGTHEYKIAKKVCNALKIGGHKLVSIQKEWLFKFRNTYSQLNECNYPDLSLTTQYGFAEEMGLEYDCFLNGIFGGHLSFGSPYFTEAALLSQYSLQKTIDRLIHALGGNRYDLFLRNCGTDRLNNIADAYRKKNVLKEWERTCDASDVIAFRWDQFFLYNRIRRGMNLIDQNRFFYNDQFPFASYDLYDFYLSLAPDVSLNHLLYKKIYKKHLPHLAKIPWTSTGVNLYKKPSPFTSWRRYLDHQITWYVPRLSRGRFNYLNKLGFAKYSDAFYRQDERLADWVTNLLLSEECLSRGFYHKDGLRTLLHMQKKGISTFDEISKLIVFEIWARTYLD